ncbi:MAG: DUF3135 domain-containing protein [Burkholderiales bacterium]|jgi:hypothetical protein
MIKFNAAPEFDFDEWATLAQRDPEAFEARRRALLAIEVARGGEHAAAAKAMLERLESQLDGKAPEERARLSMLAMAASAKQMTDRLGELSARLREHADLHARARKPR